MTSIRQPRSVEAATALCERYAELDGQIAEIEKGRQADIAAINANADRAANDLIAQRDTIAAKLEPWWATAAEKLTRGKRKSIELGGCMIGTRIGKESLGVTGERIKIIAALKRLRWAKPLLRVTTSLDAKAIAKALGGKRAGELEELGLAKVPGKEAFFVERVEQAGTRGGQ